MPETRRLWLSTVAHPAATHQSPAVACSMTRDRPAGYHQDEAAQHVCQVASTPAAPVGCAIPRQTAHPGSITQPRERLSPASWGKCAIVLPLVNRSNCLVRA